MGINPRKAHEETRHHFITSIILCVTPPIYTHGYCVAYLNLSIYT